MSSNTKKIIFPEGFVAELDSSVIKRKSSVTSIAKENLKKRLWLTKKISQDKNHSKQEECQSTMDFFDAMYKYIKNTLSLRN